MSEDSYLEGILAYKRKDYPEAINLLRLSSPRQWDAQLYLAMSYFMSEQLELALQKFGELKQSCPDSDIRNKADAAFAAVNQTLRQLEKNRQAEEEATVEF